MRRWIGFALIAVVFVIVWFGMGYGPASRLVSMERGFDSLEKAGQFGDSFGYVNSFFSALAFIGIAAALLLQWHEILETKGDQEELRKAAVMQADSLFLANFFEIERNLLREQHELERIEQSAYPAAEKHIHEREVKQKKEIVGRLRHAHNLVQPHAQRVMDKLGSISKRGAFETQINRKDYPQ